MKILIAASIYPPDPGGPATHSRAQFEEFHKYGIETRLVALAHYRHWPRWIRHFLFLMALLKEARRVDIIYAHDGWGVGFPALLAAALNKKKIISRIGGDMAWERVADASNTVLSLKEWYEAGLNQNNLFFYLTRFVLRRVDAIVVTSPLLGDIYTKYYGVLAKKVHIIANPIPEPGFTEVATEQTIIYASRLVAYKNLPLVLQTLTTIFPDYPELRFIVMGDGPERAKLEAMSRDLGITEQVVFTGSVPQSEVLSRTASALFTLAPALTEFNPNYVLQGIAADKPFLVSRENGFPFRVPEDLLFSARNEAELKARIIDLLSPEGYKRAQDEVKSLNFHWSWGDNLKANAELIKQL